MNLIGKFRVMVGIAAVGLLALAGLWLSSLRSELLAQHMEKTKSLVEVPYSVVVEQHGLEEEGKITREEAQRRALETVRSMRYEGTNYFFIHDMHHIMLAHPKPDWTNKDLTDLKDPTGKAIIVEFVNVVRASHEGFVFYEWARPAAKNRLRN